MSFSRYPEWDLASPGLEAAKDGQPSAVLIVAEEAHVRRAVGEIQKYVENSGLTMKIEKMKPYWCCGAMPPAHC
jgi:hypothetical protein